MSVIILAIFLLSGFAGLSYEIVWIKKLSLIFGVGSHAVSSVVAAYMGGLALGSYLFGRLSDRKKPNLWIYVVLEVGIAASALLLHGLLPLIDNLSTSLTRQFSQFSFLFVIVRFLLCFAALLIPTTLMGATLPVISKFFTSKISRVGNRIGLLYSFNTAGGVLGCMVTGFVLLRYIGAAGTTFLAMGLNVTAAIFAAVAASRYHSSHVEDMQPAGESFALKKRKPVDENQLPDAGIRSFKRLLIFLYGGAGFTAIAYEVLWTRVLVYIMGNDTYAFTTILSTFLVGIALGSYVFAHYADKKKDLVFTFALLQLGIGFSSALLLSGLGRWFLTGFSLHPYLNFLKSFIFVFIPTFLMGAAFPVIIKLYSTRLSELGEDVGNIYAVNTIGGIIGSLSAGFILLPLLGAQRGIVFLAAISTALGITAVTAMPRHAEFRKKILLASTASVAAIIVSALAINPTAVYSKAFFENNLREILYYHESAEASLTVLRGKHNNRGLNINGETTAYTEFHDLLVHKMLAHIPVLLAGDPENALIIGFGLGSTAHSFSRHPIQRIDCAELVPEEKETARFFLPENNNILDNRRFRFIAADGRNYLKTCDAKYDIISMNAIHPKNSPYLYTREFYRLCKDKLNPQGVMCAWIPTNTPHFASLIKTFQSVFPHASLWFCNTGHMVLIGTAKRLQIDIARWQNTLAREKVKADLADLLIDDPVKLLSTMIAAEDALTQFAGDSPIQTDDLPKVEFEYFSDESKAVITSNIDGLFQNGGNVFDYLTNIKDEKTAEHLNYRLARYHESMTHAPDGLYFVFSDAKPQQIIDRMDKALAVCPDNLTLLYDYNFIWSAWIMANPGVILSDNNYLSKVEKIRHRLITHYDAILRKDPRPVIEMAAAPIRLSHAVIEYFQKDFIQARKIAARVLKVDPASATANKIYNDALQMNSGVQ